jgi:putative hydrolases of HD superfamily
MAEQSMFSSSALLVEFFHTVERLKTTERAGWKKRFIANPESVADHSYRMVILAMMSEVRRC